MSLVLRQTTNSVLMVRPAAFGFNAQTVATNAFQSAVQPNIEFQDHALNAFDCLVSRLREEGVRVHVFEDTPLPIKPDAIFPNNWLSLHQDGTAALFPMCAPNRRPERHLEWIESLAQCGFSVTRVLDWTSWEEQGRFLEGTGSLVFDHEQRIVYACSSLRTDPHLVELFSKEMGYRPVLFKAADRQGLDIYHTNVLMSVGQGFAVLCADAIVDAAMREAVAANLVQAEKELIIISFEQMENFCGNILQLEDGQGQGVIVMSERACAHFSSQQLEQLSKHGKILATPLDAIERAGGGSARCMLAEIHLPRSVQA